MKFVLHVFDIDRRLEKLLSVPGRCLAHSSRRLGGEEPANVFLASAGVPDERDRLVRDDFPVFHKRGEFGVGFLDHVPIHRVPHECGGDEHDGAGQEYRVPSN